MPRRSSPARRAETDTAQSPAAERTASARAAAPGAPTPRELAQRRQIQALFGRPAPFTPAVGGAAPVQRRAYEARAFSPGPTRPAEAVRMDGDGSIHGGTLVRLLDSGEILRVDDDKWRSSRDAPSPDELTRWYGVRRLGFTDVTGQRIYVRDDRIEALDEQEDRDAGAALRVQAIYGAEVAAEVERMCQRLGIEQQLGQRIDSR